jgi:hypothetical protein
MKTIILISLVLIIYKYANSQVNSNTKYQNGYYKPSTGNYVKPHFKTSKNETNHDNYSTQGNRNSYTGQTGYRAKDYSKKSYNYGSGKSIKTGPKGGQYYNNTYGRKTYVPKRN